MQRVLSLSSSSAAAATHCLARVERDYMPKVLYNYKTNQQHVAYKPVRVVCVAAGVEQHAVTEADEQQSQQQR
jgi:hypothetical protein